MKPSRQFRPDAPAALEDRVVPSHAAAHAAAAGHRAASAHSHSHVTATPAPPPVSFPMNIADTIAAGLPVNEQRTTRYSDGTVQTGSRLIQPNTTNSSTLTTEVINLPSNAGTESVTEFSYASASDPNTTTHVITTTFPDGRMQTENQTRQVNGNTTQFNSSVRRPTNTGVETATGQTVERGAVSITNKTVNVPDGTVDKYHIVTVHYGELLETTTSTETLPNGRRKVTRSTTTIVRVAAPRPTSVGTLAPGATITPPKTA